MNRRSKVPSQATLASVEYIGRGRPLDFWVLTMLRLQALRSLPWPRAAASSETSPFGPVWVRLGAVQAQSSGPMDFQFQNGGCGKDVCAVELAASDTLLLVAMLFLYGGSSFREGTPSEGRRASSLFLRKPRIASKLGLRRVASVYCSPAIGADCRWIVIVWAVRGCVPTLFRPPDQRFSHFKGKFERSPFGRPPWPHGAPQLKSFMRSDAALLMFAIDHELSPGTIANEYWTKRCYCT